ncbi:hypothetical protein [Deinococcus planocerae]|uniref:hypothetical protein n=1 Tax=Deinococcus planocerae TaxID=1737569 RepID=UPI000C7EC843|nr:hypothetical protein [Deinococcus planocerae]
MSLRRWLLLLVMLLGLHTVAGAQQTAPVPFPEDTIVAANSSTCEQRRRAALGETSSIYNPGETVGSATVTYSALPCPTTWLAQITRAIDTAGLPRAISLLAQSVLLIGIIWNGIQIANGGALTDVRELLTRLLVSGWLVLGSSSLGDLPSEPRFTGNLGQLVRASWVEAYKWGDASFAAPALERAATETKALGEHISNLTLLFGTLQTLASGLKGGQAAPVTNPWLGFLGLLFGGAQGAASAVEATAQAGIFAINIVMPLLITYYVIIMGTGLATVLGSLLLPLAGALYIFSPGAGQQFLQTWFKTVMSAVLLMAFMPIVFSGSVEVGFVQPSRQFNAALDKTNRIIEADFKNTDALLRSGDISDFEAFRRDANSHIATLMNKVNFPSYANSMLSSLALMFFSLLAGIYLLRLAQNWIVEFLGGVAAAVGGVKPPRVGSGGVGGALSSAKSIGSTLQAERAASVRQAAAGGPTGGPGGAPGGRPGSARPKLASGGPPNGGPFGGGPANSGPSSSGPSSSSPASTPSSSGPSGPRSSSAPTVKV